MKKIFFYLIILILTQNCNKKSKEEILFPLSEEQKHSVKIIFHSLTEVRQAHTLEESLLINENSNTLNEEGLLFEEISFSEKVKKMIELLRKCEIKTTRKTLSPLDKINCEKSQLQKKCKREQFILTRSLEGKQCPVFFLETQRFDLRLHLDENQIPYTVEGDLENETQYNVINKNNNEYRKLNDVVSLKLKENFSFEMGSTYIFNQTSVISDYELSTFSTDTISIKLKLERKYNPHESLIPNDSWEIAGRFPMFKVKGVMKTAKDKSSFVVNNINFSQNEFNLHFSTLAKESLMRFESQIKKEL